MVTNTKCPQCGNKADRILFEYRYYIYCIFCGCNIIAKEISSTNVAKNL